MYKPADIIQTLRSIPYLLDCKPAHFTKLAAIASFRTLAIGESLFHEGEKVEALYILLEGQLSVDMFVPTQGRVKIFDAEPYDMIGWSVMTPIIRQRTGSVQAVKTSRLIAFDGDALHEMCEEDHDLGYIILRRVANTAASRLLTTRLQLLDIILQTTHEAY